MSYPAYVLPNATGITIAFGPFPQQPLPAVYLCSKADAQIIADSLGGVLTNPATDSSLGIHIGGLDPNSPFQPWWVTHIATPSFAGPSVAIMYAANSVNGGGVGNPGKWDSGKWVPTAPPPPPPPPPVDSSNDANAFAQMLGVGQGFGPVQQASIANIERLVVAIGKTLGIS